MIRCTWDNGAVAVIDRDINEFMTTQAKAARYVMIRERPRRQSARFYKVMFWVLWLFAVAEAVLKVAA